MRATAFRGALRGAKTQLHRATAAAASQVQRQSTRWCRAAQSHKNMLTPWEVQCQCGCFLVQFLHAAVCKPVSAENPHSFWNQAVRLTSAKPTSTLWPACSWDYTAVASFMAPTVSSNLQNAHMWQASLIGFSGARRTGHWFSSHDSHCSRRLTHSCELPHAERDLCANNTTVHNSPSSAGKFPPIPLIMNVTHTELTNYKQEDRPFKGQRPVRKTINDDKCTNESALCDY